MQVDAGEIYSNEGSSKVSAFNTVGRQVYDLRLRDDLCDPEVQLSVWEDLERDQPALVIGSPCPAAVLSAGNVTRQQQLHTGVAHLNFCVAVYNFQLDHGRLFLHEQPPCVWTDKLRSMTMFPHEMGWRA